MIILFQTFGNHFKNFLCYEKIIFSKEKIKNKKKAAQDVA